MVIKTLTCNFSQQKIYPGHGKTFVRLDAKVCNRPRAVVVPPPQQPQRDGWTERLGKQLHPFIGSLYRKVKEAIVSVESTVPAVKATITTVVTTVVATVIISAVIVIAAVDNHASTATVVRVSVVRIVSSASLQQKHKHIRQSWPELQHSMHHIWSTLMLYICRIGTSMLTR